MPYQTEIAADALDEAEQVYLWIKQRSADQARRWYRGLFEAIESLQRLPERCQIAPEGDETGLEIRQILYGKRPNVYRVVFTIVGNTVRILHIRHGARENF